VPRVAPPAVPQRALPYRSARRAHRLHAMDTPETYEALRAALFWQIELGADEAIAETPVDRYALAPPSAAAPAPPQRMADAQGPRPVAAQVAAKAAADPVAEATAAAASADSLQALAAAMAAFDHCALKPAAKSFVFADGHPSARLMIVGEAPGRDEDQQGKPFVGRAGQLLDRMLAAIGLSRSATEPEEGVYITNILPWRPPENRKPEAQERAMYRPFVERHITLAAPDLLILMGNTPCETLLGRAGITRLRGTWTEVSGRPALPMFHPAYLLRKPQAKREAWADLQEIRARLDGA